MSVANMTFMVDRLGADCAPGQFVRELTENAIAAIEALPDRRGDVIWDADWNTHMLVGRYKLCAVDTGIGMTGPEMVQYINNLSSSIHEQTNSTNFGVGAKVSAAPHNHAGILYLSWKDGVGSMIHLWRDPVANVYGLKQFERPDGTFDHWAYIENTVKPEAIQNNGTMVILLGNTEEQNTMEPPAGLPMPAKWILRYLNSRYYRFPSGIVVRVREGWTLPKTDSRHNFLRVADGMEAWLRDNAEDSGTVDLTGAKAHWWILKADVDVNSGHYTPPGHVGALYQDELYDLSTSRAGVARLQSLGVIFGHSRVVLYVEPDASGQRVEANTARTSLSINGEPLPWSEWASEFRDSFPQPLRQLVEEVGSKAAGSDHRQSIRERLKSILDLFKLPRYRPAKSGEVNIDPDSLMGGGRPRRQGGAGGEGESSSGGRGGRGGSIYGLFLAVSGIPGEEAPVKGEPERKWVSVEKGTRTAGDMDDRAAKFIAQQNLLLINEDFRGFTDHVRYWTEKYEHAPGSGSVVQEVVHEWFEQQLVEAVLGAQSLRDSPEWNMSLLEQLWSPEALTAVVLPRYHINLAIGRALGAKLGSLRDRVA
jgi:hypothetical protein